MLKICRSYFYLIARVMSQMLMKSQLQSAPRAAQRVLRSCDRIFKKELREALSFPIEKVC